MTEETLKLLPMSVLIDLLVLTTNECLETFEKKDEIRGRIKKKQLDLLYRVIKAKTGELVNGY